MIQNFLACGFASNDFFWSCYRRFIKKQDLNFDNIIHMTTLCSLKKVFRQTNITGIL